MKKNLLLLALIVCSSFTWYSCRPDEGNDPEIEVEVEEQDIWSPSNNSLFWRISGNGLQQPAHLFGTIHTIAHEDFSFEKGLDSILESSTSLMLEADISDPAIIKAVQSRMTWEKGINPDDMYTDAEVEALDALCQSLNTSWEVIKQFNPLSLEGYLSGQILKKELGITSGYEEYLIYNGQKNGTPILGAESAEYVFTYYNDIPNEEVIDRLVKMATNYLDEPETFMGSFQELVQAYLQQDLKALYDLNFKEGDQHLNERTYETLIVSRNAVWMDAIEKELSGRLVAVGAAHLGGDKGLVQLLRDKGYELTPIKVAR